MRKYFILLVFIFSMLKMNAQNWQEVGPVGKTNCANPPSIFYPCPTGLDANGAVNFVEFHPTDANTIYCSTFGGIFKSTNNGDDWVSLNIDQYTQNTTVIHAIEVDDTDPNYIYAATGYMLDIRENVEANFTIQANPFTEGIFRSADGGNSWASINSGLPNIYQTKLAVSGRQYLAGYYINDLVMCPFNSNILLAATSKGVYISNNPKSTTPTWSIISGLPSSNFRCIRFLPGSSSSSYTVFVSGNDGIYKSTDMINWTSLIGTGTGLDSSAILGGCFTQPPNTIDFAIDVSTVNPGWLYAIVTPELKDAANVSVIKKIRKIFKYNGTSWTLVKDLETCSQNASYWYHLIAVDPITDELYFTGDRLHKLNSITLADETIAGYWTRSNNNSVHADMRHLRFHTNTAIRKLYCPNDGLLSIFDPTCTSYISSYSCWLPVSNNGLRATRTLGFDGSSTNPNHYILGTWDTGSSRFIDGSWFNYYAGDGLDQLILKDDLFIENNASLRRYNTSLNQSMTLGSPDSGKDWINKSHFKDTYAGSTFYRCGYHVYRYTDWGATGPTTISYSAAYAGSSPEVISSFAVSPYRNNYMYYAIKKTADDNYVAGTPASNKIIWLLKITNASVGWQNASNNLPYRDDNISSIAVSLTNPNLIYIAYEGRNTGRGKIFQYNTGTSNSSEITDATWTDYKNSQNTIPWYYKIYGIAIEPGSSDAMYAATDGGIYYTDNSMTGWVLFDNNVLPPTAAVNLYVNNTYVSAATFGSGVWRSTLACTASTTNWNLTGTMNVSQGYDTKGTIRTSQVIGNNLNTITYKSGSSIRFTNGFKVNANDYNRMHAWIKPCHPAGSYTMPPLKTGIIEEPVVPLTEEKTQETEIKDFDVFPSPNEGNFKISVLDSSLLDGELTILNSMGRTVYSDKLKKEDPTMEINLKDPEAGVYILRIYTRKKSVSKKMMVHPGTTLREEEEEEHGRIHSEKERREISKAGKKAYRKFQRSSR